MDLIERLQEDDRRKKNSLPSSRQKLRSAPTEKKLLPITPSSKRMSGERSGDDYDVCDGPCENKNPDKPAKLFQTALLIIWNLDANNDSPGALDEN